MSGPLGSHELMYATGSEFYEHQISNSMVFAGVQDLDRSRSSAGSQTTATISFKLLALFFRLKKIFEPVSV